MTTVDVAKKCLPHVMVHDEEAAKSQTGQQATFTPVKTVAAVTWIKVPWVEWARTRVAKDMQAKATDMGAITQVLHALFTSAAFLTESLDITTNKETMRTFRVTVVAEVPAMKLHIPPCCPKAAKIVTHTDNQSRVTIKVTRKFEEKPTTHTPII